MEIVIISLAAFLAAILTFFSGFGLGTVLTPVFAIFFPIEVAVALTGVVHFFNNIFKLFLVGKKANKNVLLRFGIPAVLAAALGAWLLLELTGLKPLLRYSVGERTFEVSPVNLTVALLLIAFAMMELIPRFRQLQFGKRQLPLGGALSGFFGGLSGNQGALRSAFLIRAGLSKEAFIGTGVVVSTFIDLTRLSVYSTRFATAGLEENVGLVAAATLAAITGAFLGNRLLKKLTLGFIQKLVAVMLLLLSVALGAGFI